MAESRQHARGLERSHLLAAIMTLIRWRTRHRGTVLHRIRIKSHCRHTIREL
jgi:hypothetical protein